MAARVRPRLLTAATAAALVAACDGERPVAPGPGPAATAATDPRPALQAATDLVARSQGPRRGGFDRLLVELRRSPGDPPTTVAAALPARLRIARPDGSALLRTAAGAWTCGPDGRAAAADPAVRAELEAWAAVLDLLALGPLERATVAERLGPDRIAVGEGPDRTEVRYDPARDQVLELAAGGRLVRILERHVTERTVIPTRIEAGELGVWQLRFVETGVDLDDKVFALPGHEAGPQITLGGPAPAAGPRLEERAAVSWLIAADPGTWAGRMELYRAAGARLGPLGYGNGGDPMLVRDGERRWFVVPFRERRGDAAPVEPRPGERVEQRPAGRELAVAAAPGPFDARVEAGIRELLEAARDSALGLEGPICIAVNLIGRDPAADPGCLDEAPVQILAPIVR